MLKKLKKMFILIPCAIFCLFLFGGKTVSATEAIVTEIESISVGEGKENVYYFTNSDQWNILITDIDIVGEWDTYLQYRVVRPDGSATAWSKKIKYPDTKGKFSINAFSESLSFTETVNIYERNSIVPGSTYYVDIEYYSQFLWSEKNQNKGETLKIVYNANNNGELYTPNVDVKYESTVKSYIVNASIVDKDKKGLSVIEKVEYLYSTEKLTLSDYDAFAAAYKESEVHGVLSVDYKSSFEGSIESSTSEQKYLYVYVETANGFYEIKEINLETKVEEGTTDKDKTPLENNNASEDTGLFDYDFGQFILLVLIIVLIVSCALIIAQKIIDYKKRLY